MGLSGFYWILEGLSGFEWVLLAVTQQGSAVINGVGANEVQATESFCAVVSPALEVSHCVGRRAAIAPADLRLSLNMKPI